MPACYRAKDVDEAIELAARLQEEKGYDLFRGQVRSEWRPHTSLVRMHMRDPDALEGIQRQMVRFQNWLLRTPGLEDIGKDTDATIAIAQHYGIPTSYLDFTTDPAVAGFFAAHTAEPQIEIESCIFCLDSSDLVDLWNWLREARDGELPELEVVRPCVPNLWRLQAQRGVFLYVPMNWDLYYGMDRILFPYTGHPSYPTKRDIYPDRKSQLEILLDQFFDNEHKIVGEKHFRKFFEEVGRNNPNAVLTEASAPQDGYLPEYVRGGRLAPHPSWGDATHWLTIIDEAHGDVWSRDNSLSIDLELSAPEIARRIANGSRRAMDRDETLRNHSINWRLEPTSLKEPLRPALYRGLKLLWDGLRKLPLTNAEIASALGNWVGLYSLGFDVASERGKRQVIFDSLFGKSIWVEFGAQDGSSSRGFASVASLRDALRSDLAEVLTDKANKRADDLEFLFQIVMSPNRLFDFRKLAGLFATQVAPSHLVRSEPHFFTPARLSILGHP